MAQRLEWSSPDSFGITYELKAQDAIVGRLTLSGVFAKSAEFEHAQGRWIFKGDPWGGNVEVLTAETNETVARYTSNTWSYGGTLALVGGPQLRFSTKQWQNDYRIEQEDGTVLVRYQMHGLWVPKATVDIMPEAQELPNLVWIVALGWYLTVHLAWRQSAIGF